MITEWSYPLSGIENFFKQTISWIPPYHEIIWASFKDNKNNHYDTIELIQGDIKYLHWPQKYGLNMMIRTLLPKIIHYVGSETDLIQRICIQNDIRLILGIHHFRDIPKVQYDHPNIKIYCVSEWMKRKIENTKLYVLNPVPSLNPLPINPKEYFTIIGIQSGKGGNLYYSLIQRLPQIKFLVVLTPPHDIELENSLRLLNNVTLLQYQDSLEEVYSKSIAILLATRFEETYSRICHEAIYYSIPLITSGKGNIRELGSHSGIYVDGSIQGWVEQIVNLKPDMETMARAKDNLPKIEDSIRLFMSLIHE